MVRRFDIWSSACVFAEMLDGRILFPGESDMSQLLNVAELLGKDRIETGIRSYVRIKMNRVIPPLLALDMVFLLASF
jgi:serine/threonine protein kinase